MAESGSQDSTPPEGPADVSPPDNPKGQMPRWLWILALYLLAITPLRSCTRIVPNTNPDTRFEVLMLSIYWPLLLVAGILYRQALSRILGNGLALGITIVSLWLLVAGSYNYWADATRLTTCLMAAIIIAALLPETRKRIFASHFLQARPGPRYGALLLLLFLVPAWLWTSWADYTYTRSSARAYAPQPTRFRAIWNESPWPSVRFAVTLSGGGYRAALMHAGVLSMLDALSVRITHINSVSGGAIIAAYYAAGGDPRHFRELMASPHVSLLRQLIRVPNALCILFPLPVIGTDFSIPSFYECDRLDVQATLLDERFSLQGLTLKQLASTSGPRLMISTTDLNSGDGIGLTASGLVKARIQRPWEPYEPDTGGPFPRLFTSEAFPAQEKLTRLVATSGAFPFAFAPNIVESKIPTGTLRLADGGLVDNTGLLLLRDAQVQLPDDWKFDIVIVSDASALFEDDTEPSAPVRAADVVYTRLAAASARREDNVTYFSADDAALVGYGADDQFARPKLRQMFDEAPEAVRELTQLPFDLRPGDPGYDKTVYEHLNTMNKELDQSLKTFRKTATLDDQPDPQTVTDLFRLGQYLIAIKWADIKASAASFESARGG